MSRFVLLGALLLAPFAFTAPAPVEAVSPLGTWYLNAQGSRLTLRVEKAGAGAYKGTLAREGQPPRPIDNVSFDARARRLEFRWARKALWEWYRGHLVEGVLVGRFSRSDALADRPAKLTAYAWHVTGWNSDELDRDIVPRVFELVLNGDYRGRLRLDRAAGGKGIVGRLKVYSTIAGGTRHEEPEIDLDVIKWDGTNLEFIRPIPLIPQIYTGKVTGRTIRGTFTQKGAAGAFDWHGTRAEVLGYGLTGKTAAKRAAWQRRTRRQLHHLMMGGNPAPSTRKVTELQANLPPLRSKKLPPDRDDNPERWPQNYRRTELQFDYTLPNPYGGPAIARQLHAWLAVPQGKAPKGGRPAVVAVNGHGGSAWQMLNPDSEYFWYGDAFARRGYVVLALDISHRPMSDRRGLYAAVPDDPANKNGYRPAVKAAGFDSDWEEDGERAWDVMRALDHLLARPDVDRRRVLVTGLSMGGEVATIAAALDPRLAMSVPAGYSPDMGVMLWHGNHLCFCWLNADVREYVDVSDFHALTAPRPLLIQTGKRDTTFSAFRPPFAGDRQVVRRARAAYGTGPLVHYLHYDEHHYHVGDINPARATERGVRVPVLAGPKALDDIAWQSDTRTKMIAPTLFDWIAGQWK
jgi:dienelactone hydrolase